ncbi:MAG: class I SAM-dependent DNA methyltransferase [Promethearchaeota archaeon]
MILLSSKEKLELDFQYISENLKKLGDIGIKNDLINEKQFKEWQKDFGVIYGVKQTDLRLYTVLFLIYLIGYVFISKYILDCNNILLNQNFSFNSFKKIEENTKIKYNHINIFEIKYFEPLFFLSKKEDLNFFCQFVLNVSNYIFKLKIPPTYFFDYLIQKIISPIIRHKSGEYYTPPFLARQMIKESYLFGETILDPSCGSGNFLTEIIQFIISQNKPKEEKISAIDKVYGYDVNPISIYISKINLLFILKDYVSDEGFHLYIFDSLFQKNENFNRKYDLIIGNPPWYTYRDIPSINYQNKAKMLAEQLEIKPLPKNLLNLEMSTLFFNKARDSYMKEGAKIFFVITKGVITGSHASRFRNFKGFSDVKIWTFDKKIENLFNIDFICLFGKKSRKKSEESIKEIPSYHFSLNNEIENIDYFDNIDLKLEKELTLVPYIVEKKSDKLYTRKFISKENSKRLLPIRESHYKKLFHKGADLNPRNLIFVRFDNIDNDLVKINPDERIFKRAKSPWNKKEFKDVIIENKYLFKVIKSTELVKFHAYGHYDVFLPLNKSNLAFHYDDLASHAKLFYDKIDNMYKRYKKTTTKHKSLMDNLNRWSKLINERQRSKIKVVYNNSGSIVYSAVLQGEFIITGDLSFYNTNNLEEAHYLSAILNSNLITKQVRIIKSSRHIFKLPLDFPIKKFNSHDPNHKKLAELGKEGQIITKKTINTFIENNNAKFTKIKIQNELNKKLKPILKQIDDILVRDLQDS